MHRDSDTSTLQAWHGNPDECAEGIAVVVLTYGRLHLLVQCVERVLARTSPATHEIIVWNNGATDGTREYLDSLTDPRIRVVHHPENIGQSAYARAFALTSATYLLELDDDMVDAPQHWDMTLLEAFRRLPDVGFLAAALVDNPDDPSAEALYRGFTYQSVEENGVNLLLGPTGGGCAITSRSIYESVGGFRQDERVFFQEDGAYVQDIARLGFRSATLADLKLLHAGGPHYSDPSPEKVRFWTEYQRRIDRKRAVKRALLAVPTIRALNNRHRWFRTPEETAAEDALARIWLRAGRDQRAHELKSTRGTS